MEVDGTLLTILGVAAGILILTGWVEQIYKGYKTKSLKDVSKFLMIFISAGAILWLDLWNNSIRCFYHRNKHCCNCFDDDSVVHEAQIRQTVTEKNNLIKN